MFLTYRNKKWGVKVLVRKKGVLLAWSTHLAILYGKLKESLILFYFFTLVRRFMKPSNAVSHELKHTFTAFTCLTTVSAGAHCTAANAKIPKQQHLSAPLCLLFTRWLAACRVEIRSWMCWPNTLGLNIDLPCQLCLWMGLNASANSHTQTSTAGKTYDKQESCSFFT